MTLLLERGTDWGYLPDIDTYFFIVEFSAQEAVSRWEFESEGHTLELVGRVDTWGPIWVPGNSWRHGCDPNWRHGTTGCAP